MSPPLPRLRPRVGLITGVAAMSLVASTLAVAWSRAQSAVAASCTDLTMYAEQLPNERDQVRLGYGLTPDTARIPGPTIKMAVGDCLDIKLVNDIPAATLVALKQQYGGEDDLPIAASIHPHGAKYGRGSDGTMTSDSFVPPGRSRVFRWRATNLSPGYWWYHDHVVGTDHGTGGIASGLFGGLVIREPDDPQPDRATFVVAMGDDSTINLKHHPRTPEFTAREGERIEFLVFAWGNETHSFHLHGHTWYENRTGLVEPRDPSIRLIDNVTIAPGSSFGFQVIAGQDVGPNQWMYHCHVQFHSDAGMMGFLRVLPPA